MRKAFAWISAIALCLLTAAGCGEETTPEYNLDLNGNSITGPLMCRPAVFVVENDYEILVVCKKKGLIYVKVEDDIYRPKNSGVLETEVNYAKIRLPQSALDAAKKYTVCYKKSLKRLSYYSLLGKTREFEFEFCPVSKTESLRVYHFADIHGNFNLAKRCLNNFGPVDLLICNGDMADQCASLKTCYNICKFLGEVGYGKTPIVFSRGNHETRGKIAPLYGDFFPCENGNCFFSFSVGSINGVVLDCGEDKLDANKEYGGVNDFESYRRRETEFLKGLSFPNDGKWRIAICHICPSSTTTTEGDKFDIERETYKLWIDELQRLEIHCMLCGHLHSYYTFDSESEYNLLPHTYPVFTASKLERGMNKVFGGAAILLDENDMILSYTDSDGQTLGTYKVTKSGN